MPLQVLRPYHSKKNLNLELVVVMCTLEDTFKTTCNIKIDKKFQVVHLIGELIGIYK